MLQPSQLCRHQLQTWNFKDIDLYLVCHSIVWNDDLPLYETCGLQLKVKHFLVECPSLKDIHEKYFMVSSVKELFDSVDNQSIIGLITETHFIVSCDVCYLNFTLAW